MCTPSWGRRYPSEASSPKCILLIISPIALNWLLLFSLARWWFYKLSAAFKSILISEVISCDSRVWEYQDHWHLTGREVYKGQGHEQGTGKKLYNIYLDDVIPCFIWYFALLVGIVAPSVLDISHHYDSQKSHSEKWSQVFLKTWQVKLVRNCRVRVGF